MNCISEEQWSDEQLTYIAELRQMLLLLSRHTNIKMCIKNTNLRYIYATTDYAKMLGYECDNLVHKSDQEILQTNSYADTNLTEDLSLLSAESSSRSFLKIYHYADGVHARIFHKKVITYKQSILGFLYQIDDADIAIITDILYRITNQSQSPEYSYHDKYQRLPKLTQYEQEFCFLLSLNWSISKITDCMNTVQQNLRVADSSIKKKNYLCEKFGLSTTSVAKLQQEIIKHRLHRKMPQSFLNHVIGSSEL